MSVETCPFCGGEDLKGGAALLSGKTFDYGCRDCRRVFDDPEDVSALDVKRTIEG